MQVDFKYQATVKKILTQGRKPNSGLKAILLVILMMAQTLKHTKEKMDETR